MRSKRVTIAHLITELNRGGAEQMLYKLVCRINKEKLRPIVISMTDKGFIGRRIHAKGIPVFELGMELGRPTAKGAARLFGLLRKESVEIIQSWLYHADFLGLMVGKLARIRRIVWGIRCSDMDLANYRRLTYFVVKANAVLSNFVDAIVVNSVRGKAFHSSCGYNHKKMVMIPNGFDLEEFRPEPTAKKWLLGKLGLPDNVFLVGMVGRFDPMKDHETFLRAASLLGKRNPWVHFVMVGKDMLPQNPALSPFLNSNLKERIHLLGPQEEMCRITASFDIATSSSAYGEGFSNTIGEAMACGVPCAVTDVGDSARIVGDTGFVVPPRSPEALARAWAQLLDLGREGRMALGEKARSRIRERYEIGEVAERFEKLYESLL